MSRKENSKQVVIKNKKSGTTDVWHKNSAGCTTKEGHRVHHHGSGNVTNHYGRKVNKS